MIKGQKAQALGSVALLLFFVFFFSYLSLLLINHTLSHGRLGADTKLPHKVGRSSAHNMIKSHSQFY